MLASWLLGFLSHHTYAQDDDLMSMLEDEAALKKEFMIATFKAPRLIQGHTIEQPAAKNLLFIISHR
ncbi:hypothetical protein N9C06_03850 [Salibacteraceae bacterium]|nr:hypothetical protein [Salibacteraceae bacterium]